MGELDTALEHLYRGVIVGLYGSWQSGLGELQLEDNHVFCENAPTVRAMDRCFGGVIGPGHTIDNDNGGHVGKEIFYTIDAFNVLVAFTPVDEAPQEMIDYYENQPVPGDFGGES